MWGMNKLFGESKKARYLELITVEKESLKCNKMDSFLLSNKAKVWEKCGLNLNKVTDAGDI